MELRQSFSFLAQGRAIAHAKTRNIDYSVRMAQSRRLTIYGSDPHAQHASEVPAGPSAGGPSIAPQQPLTQISFAISQQLAQKKMPLSTSFLLQTAIGPPKNCVKHYAYGSIARPAASLPNRL